MDHQIVISFNSDQMIDAIERNTGKIVNRSREDLLAGLVAVIQDGIKGLDPKGFLAGMFISGGDALFEMLPGNQDLFLDV